MTILNWGVSDHIFAGQSPFIDRSFGINEGTDDLNKLLDLDFVESCFPKYCRYCGIYKTAGAHEARGEYSDTEMVSKSWQEVIDRHKEENKKRERYCIKEKYIHRSKVKPLEVSGESRCNKKCTNLS